jgi:hypothetical protein
MNLCGFIEPDGQRCHGAPRHRDPMLLYCLLRLPGTVLLLTVLGVTRLNLALPVLAALYRFIDRGQQTRLRNGFASS